MLYVTSFHFLCPFQRLIAIRDIPSNGGKNIFSTLFQFEGFPISELGDFPELPTSYSLALNGFGISSSKSMGNIEKKNLFRQNKVTLTNAPTIVQSC